MSYAYEEPGYIKICGSIQEEATNKYRFVCTECKASLLLGTDGGRYGNIGEFACQCCGAKYYATDDDQPDTVLHIFKDGKKLFDLANEYNPD